MKEALTIPEEMANGYRRNITGVINDYSKRLLAFIRKRVGNEADAEDILQDVFQQFIGNTQPIEQLTAWLFTVARNKITDRNRKRRPEHLEDIFSSPDPEDSFNWADLLFSSEGNPETEFLRSMFWETLNKALDELPEEQKRVFVKHELEGVSFLELSEESGLPVPTLISRKRYAVLHLRERLQLLRNELLQY